MCVVVGVLWAGLDELTKTWVVDHLRGGRVIQLLGGHLLLEQDRNPGAAFGIGTGSTVVFSVVAVVVIVIVLRTSRRLGSIGWAIGLGLLLGGALGNLSDRIFRSPGVLRGWVVDWIDLRWWPVFNLADSGIVLGAVLLVLLSMRGVRLDGSRG
jgi:signal peptidase II